MTSYYQVQYHVKNAHVSNWSVFYTVDTEKEAYDFLLQKLEEKFTRYGHKDIDLFRIVKVNEEEVYTTWTLEAQSGR